MPYYLHQWSYKDQQVRMMLVESVDRSEVVRIAIEAFGGKLHCFYYCLGQYDGLAISEFPNSESAFASVLSICGQGRIDVINTTALFSAEEGLRSIRQASEVIRTQSPTAGP